MASDTTIHYTMPTYPLGGWGCFNAGWDGNEERLAEHHRAGGSLDLGDSDYGHTAAHGAAAHGRVGTLRLLDGNGADMNIRNNRGTTPLMVAARNGQLDATRMLVVDVGVDTTLKDNDGRTAAQWAREKGHPEVAEFLEQHSIAIAPKAAAAKFAALVQALLVCAVVSWN